MNITEQEMREFVGKFFPSKELNYASDECIQIQAGEQFGIPMHYEYHLGTVALHLEQKDWRAIRNHLNANLHNERLIPSNWFGRNNCQWTIDGEIHTVHDMFQAFLDIRSIIEPVIEQFDGKEPQDYSRYTLDEAERLTTESKTPVKTQEEIKLTLLADKEMVVLYDTKIANIQFVSAALCGGWIGTSVIPEVCQVKRNADEMTVQMHLYADNYCKGVQLLLKQKGDDIYGKIEWAKGTKRRAERNERIEKILQSDWNDTSDADVANLETSIPIGKTGYGVERIIVEIEPQEEVSKEEAKEQEPEMAKEIETKNEKVKCPNCGAESAGKFCPECGTPLQKMSSQPQSEVKMKGTGESKSIKSIEPKTMKVVEKKQNSVERNHENVQQIPVILEDDDYYRQLEFSVSDPESLFSSEGFFLECEIKRIIEDAAKDYRVYSSDGKKRKRALEHFSEFSIEVAKGKMLFAQCVEKRIVREILSVRKIVGKECEQLKKLTTYNSPYEMPFMDSSELQTIREYVYRDWEGGYEEDSEKTKIYDFEIKNGTNEKCEECGGEKIERCPECDGSGREQYIDSYFASGDPKYKTGQCSRCYGKGFIKCRHCGGSGMEYQGDGTYAIIQSFREKCNYHSTCCAVTPWGLSKGRWFYHFDTMGTILSVKYDTNRTVIDDRKEIRDKVLSEMGYEYGLLYDNLMQQIESSLNQQAEKEDLPVWKVMNYHIYDAYRVDYAVGGQKYHITLIVNRNNGKGFASFGLGYNNVPKMGLFGGIKKTNKY